MPTPQQQQEPLKPATPPEAEPEPELQPEALPEQEQQDTWTAPPEPEQEQEQDPEPARELEACSCCLLNSAHAAVLDHARNLWWQACLKICLRSWPMAGHSQLANKATRSCIDVAQEFVQHAHSCQASSLHSAMSALFKV